MDGKLLFAAGELVATSPETGADGYTYFDCDIPIRGEYYGSSIRKDATTNSGNYIVKELRAPLGYYVNEEPMEVTFTYDGQAIMVLDNTCANKPTEMWVSKRDLTNDEELPGATLAIKDMDGNIVTTWVSTDEPHRVTGLREERARPHGNAKNKKAHLCPKTKMRLARLVYQPLQPCSSQSPATAGSTIWVGSILPSGVRDTST